MSPKGCSAVPSRGPQSADTDPLADLVPLPRVGIGNN